MAGLGLILLVLAGALTAAVVLNNTDATTVSAYGTSLTNLSVGELFLFGALTGLVFGLGLSMMLAGAARQRAKRRAMKTQTKAIRSERETLAEENARLQDELSRTRGADDVYPVEGGKHARRDEVSGGRGGLFRR